MQTYGTNDLNPVSGSNAHSESSQTRQSLNFTNPKRRIQQQLQKGTTIKHLSAVKPSGGEGGVQDLSQNVSYANIVRMQPADKAK